MRIERRAVKNYKEYQEKKKMSYTLTCENVNVISSKLSFIQIILRVHFVYWHKFNKFF
jgi:hypothetical protein